MFCIFVPIVRTELYFKNCSGNMVTDKGVDINLKGMIIHKKIKNK